MIGAYGNPTVVYTRTFNGKYLRNAMDKNDNTNVTPRSVQYIIYTKINKMTKKPTYVMCNVCGPPALVRIDYAGGRVFFGDSTGLQRSYKLFENNDSAGIATTL